MKMLVKKHLRQCIRSTKVYVFHVSEPFITCTTNPLTEQTVKCLGLTVQPFSHFRTSLTRKWCPFVRLGQPRPSSRTRFAHHSGTLVPAVLTATSQSNGNAQN